MINIRTLNSKKNIRSKKVESLTKVDWVKGYSLIINLKKFRNPKIFDKNYFLYLEEIDLCKSVLKRSGNIYFSHDLKIRHLGAKGSTARSTEEKKELENLRNWHYMWSSFYFYKKHYGYFFAVKQLGGKLFRSLIKTFIFLIFFQKNKKDKYLFRFLGLFYSMIGKKAFYRIEKN